MQHLEVSGAVRPLKWSLGVKWLIASHLCYLIKYLVVFMTVGHTYFYILVDTQRGCRTLKFTPHYGQRVNCTSLKQYLHLFTT